MAKLTGATLVPSSRTDGPRSAGTLQLEFEVSDSIFFGPNALPTRHVPTPTENPMHISVSQVRALSVSAPRVLDITGLTLDMSVDDMAVMLTANGPGQQDLSHPFNRQIAPTSVPGHGTRPGTEAFTSAKMRVDRAAEEMILALSDSRTKAAHVALGRLKLYEPANITAEGVIGALLKKYGEPDFTRDDRRGGSPLKRLVWGYNPSISLPQCLPPLNGSPARNIRDAFEIKTDEDRATFTLAQMFAMPEFGPLAENLPDFSSCGPVVVAEVSARQGKLSLVTWVIDPAALQGIRWTPEPTKDAETLVEGAADIDL